MSCKVTCPICNKTFSVADKYRGRNAVCSCGNRLKIPEIISIASSGHSPAPKDQSHEKKTYIDSGSDKSQTNIQHKGLSDKNSQIDASSSDYLDKGSSKKVFGIVLLFFFISIFVITAITIAILYSQRPKIEALGYKSLKVLNESTHNVFGKFETDPGDMFLVVEVSVPVGSFVVRDLTMRNQDISKRWADYIAKNNNQFSRKCTTIKEYLWNCPINGQTEERLPTIPNLSLQPCEGLQTAVFDPQCFRLEGDSDDSTRGCLIAFNDWSRLPDNTLWHYYMSIVEKTQTVRFNPENNKNLPLPWDEVITLYLPDTIDNRTRVTLSIAFIISENDNPLSSYHTIRFDAQKRFQLHCQSQIPEKIIEWHENHDRWNISKAYGRNMLNPDNRNDTTTELIWNIDSSKFVIPTYGRDSTTSNVEVESQRTLSFNHNYTG